MEWDAKEPTISIEGTLEEIKFSWHVGRWQRCLFHMQNFRSLPHQLNLYCAHVFAARAVCAAPCAAQQLVATGEANSSNRK
jgi:hypothetical protein